MNPTARSQDLVSALADGQLSGEAFAAALQACRDDEALVGQWATYHLIGDVLRSPNLAASDLKSGFSARLASRLALEPLPGALASSVGSANRVDAIDRAAPPAPGMAVPVQSRPAANDFRWKMVAGFASVAAVAAIAWTVTGMSSVPAGPQLALQSPPQTQPQQRQLAGEEQILVASPQGTMVRDARLEEMLAAHKQFGGTSALQVPSGFLRNATFETSQPGR
ncbi:MAG: anti-sigma factor [Comamonadaceae bacterium]|nr:MAG: anti-sigma factor [Comamonadaceae bacterium]